MGLYNFEQRFEDGIRSGAIRHTIRGPRYYGRQRSEGCQDKPGDIMHLYTGMRTKICRLLGRFPCAAVEQIRIARYSRRLLAIEIEGNVLTRDERESFARRDGFQDWNTMERYWLRYRKLPFRGFVLHWDFAHPIKTLSNRAVCAPAVTPGHPLGREKRRRPRMPQQSGTSVSTTTTRARSTDRSVLS